jgi:hypothetical protein
MTHIEIEEQKRINKFTQWLHDGQAETSMLKVKHYKENFRGVHAAKDIERSDDILFIPLKRILRYEIIEKSTFIQEAQLSHIDHKNGREHVALCIYIMFAFKGVNYDEFGPYLDILPKKCRNFPILFTKQELSFLEGSSFVKQISDIKQGIRKIYTILCAQVTDFNQFDFDYFCQIWCIVNSRSYDLDINGRS